MGEKSFLTYPRNKHAFLKVINDQILSSEGLDAPMAYAPVSSAV